MSHFATKVLWRFFGIFVPALQAIWTNRHIRGSASDFDSFSGRFDEDFIASWELKLKANPGVGDAPDKIYEHEIVRRQSITSKAQSSLNSAALVVAAVSLAIAMLQGVVDVMSVIPEWMLALALFYFVMAFWLAFRALHVHRYIYVEFDELDALVKRRSSQRTGDAIVRGLRARRLAAVVMNRRQTLCESNLVEASFGSLRNGLLVVLAAVLWGWLSPTYAPPTDAREVRGHSTATVGERHDQKDALRKRHREIWP